MAGERSTKLEVEERISKIFNWRLNGYQKHDLLRLAAAEGWGVAERTVEYYITEAKKRLVEFNKSTQEQDLADLVSLHFQNYLTVEAKDRAAILKEIARLKGLDQINLNLRLDRPLKELSDEELEKQALEALGLEE